MIPPSVWPTTGVLSCSAFNMSWMLLSLGPVRFMSDGLAG